MTLVLTQPRNLEKHDPTVTYCDQMNMKPLLLLLSSRPSPQTPTERHLDKKHLAQKKPKTQKKPQQKKTTNKKLFTHSQPPLARLRPPEQRPSPVPATAPPPLSLPQVWALRPGSKLLCGPPAGCKKLEKKTSEFTDFMAVFARFGSFSHGAVGWGFGKNWSKGWVFGEERDS